VLIPSNREALYTCTYYVISVPFPFRVCRFSNTVPDLPFSDESVMLEIIASSNLHSSSSYRVKRCGTFL